MTHTIERIVNQEEAFGDRDPKMVPYELAVSGVNEPVWAYRPEGQPAPQVGDVGIIDRAGKRPKFKKASQGSPNGAGGGYNDPATIARITRSHSQEMALRLLDQTNYLDGLNLDNQPESSAALKVLQKLTDWFDKDVQAAKPVEPTPPVPEPAPESTVEF